MDKKNKPEHLRQDIINEITSLRIQFRDIMTRYQANLEAKMVWCINNLTTSEIEKLPAAAKDKKELAEMLETLKLLKLKPQKGRLKDIRKIDDITAILLTKLSEE